MSERTAATTDPDTTDAADGAAQTPTEVTSDSTVVVRALENAGVETTLGVQGGATMPIYDAPYHSDIRHVTMAHEQGAAHAADAYGVVRSDLGVCLATSGPGATNLVTGIADANMDSNTVLALTGQVPSDIISSDAFQGTDTTGVTAPTTKHNYFASLPDTVGDTVGEAFALAAEGRPGPTLIDLPKDVSLSETDTESGSAQPPETCRARIDPADSQVEAAARAIERAEKPLLLFGGGVVKTDATEVARQFTTEHRILVVTTMPGIGAMPEGRELCLSQAGMYGTGYANMATTHTDCLIAVGTWFDDRLIGGTDTFAPEVEVVHIDISPAEISKNVRADYPVVSNAGRAIERVDAKLDEGPDAREWVDQCLVWKDDYPMDYAAPDNEPLKPRLIVEALDEAMPDETTVTSGVGQHQMWAAQYWTFTEPRRWVSSHGLGAMGYGLPAAIGTWVAADDDGTVVCVGGDASFLMTIQELSVAVRENFDITVAILNNEYIGMARQWQDTFFEGRYMATGYDQCPQFDKLAEAFGARGWIVDSYEEIPDVIEETLTHDDPSIIDFHAGPAENVYPMVSSGGANGKFTLSGDQL